MAIAKKCDRCGKYYEPYRDNGKHNINNDVNGIAFVHIKLNDGYSGIPADGHDLCRDCLDKVIEFIDGGRANGM